MINLDPIDITTNEFAEFFDEITVWAAPFGLLLLRLVPLRRGLRILDVGAGTGFPAIELAERCGPDAKVVAVDPWSAACARMRRKAAHRKLHNLVVFEEDAATITLEDASIDLIVSNLGINNFDDPSAVLRNCFRVASPGATLAITTNLTGHMEEFYDVFRSVLADLDRTASLQQLDAHIRHRGTPTAVAKLVTDAGFDLVDTVTESFTMRFADGTAFFRHSFIRMAFVPAWTALLSPSDLETVFQRVEHHLNTIAAETGDLTLSIPMACIVAMKPDRT